MAWSEVEAGGSTKKGLRFMATCGAIYDTFPSKYSRFARQELSAMCTRWHSLFPNLSLPLSTQSPTATCPDNCSLDPKTDLSFSPCAKFDEFATWKEMPIAVKDINCADSEKCCNATSNPTASPTPTLSLSLLLQGATSPLCMQQNIF